MAEYYELENLWVVRKENSVRIFFHFFNWCMHKRYVSYRINMAQEEKAKAEGKETEQEGVKVEWFFCLYLEWITRSGIPTWCVWSCRQVITRAAPCSLPSKWGNARSCSKISIKSSWALCSYPRRFWVRSYGRWSSSPSEDPHSRRREKITRIKVLRCCSIGPGRGFWWIAGMPKGGCWYLLVLGF